jgi:hypothetical protein
MLTDLTVADLDADRRPEIIATGEWIAPAIIRFINGKLELINSGLEAYKGWWQSVAVTDLDADGDQDLVLGNTGKNGYLRPDKDHPVKLWVSDFDQNGTADKIISRHINGKDVPVFLKRELTDQMPSLKKQNLKFEQYAGKSVQDLFGSQVKEASVQEYHYSASVIAINDGKGRFTIQELPVMTQLSCINAILCSDIDGDGRKDLVLGGNQFHFQPQFARLDASYGHILLNKGMVNGNIRWQMEGSAVTGLLIKGEVKEILPLARGSIDYLLVLQNNLHPLLLKKNK